MDVELRLFASLRQYLPPGPGPNLLQLEPGCTVAQLLQAQGVPLDAPRVFFVNGRHVELDHPLQDGDVLSVFPPVAGG